MDEETGLYYYGARYYNPKTGLWLSVDPLAEKYPNISPYAYTLNNPIKYIDPDGEDVILWLVNTIKVVGKGKGNYVNGSNHFKLYASKNYVSKHLESSIKKFVTSKTGREFILQYMKKGQSFYGIKATEDGKLSDQNLNIYDIRNNNDIDKKYIAVMSHGPYVANAITSFDEKTGDLNVYMGTAGSDDVNDTTQTLTHELGQHGVHHEKYLNMSNKGQKEELRKEQIKDYKNDHSESRNRKGAKIYNKIMKELNMKPKWSEK